MSTTHMPGFTAATSLYPTAGRYRSAGTPGLRPESRAIEPQLPIGFCMADCDFQNPNDPLMASICKFGCFDDAQGAAGDGGGISSRACIQCRGRCNRKPVSQRAACRADCDDTVC
jgi:hypothetical protein